MEPNVTELLETIKQHNAAYRKGRPEVPDSVYDREVEMLREIDPDNEWFHQLEPAEVKARRKVTLPIPMRSLNKVKDMADLNRWFQSTGLGADDFVVVMPKFDGLSLLCNENTGQAWSRGGTENEGQDCSDHIIAANVIHDTLWPFTYGEFVFSVENWEKHFTDKINPDTGKPFKSPRNTAAGLLNRDKPSNDLQYVDFYRYGTDPKTVEEYNTFIDLIDDLCECFDQKKLRAKFKTKEFNETLLANLFKDWRREYYIDGLVLYVDDLQKWNSLGRQQTTGNPNYAIAYKHPDFTDAFETTVKGISWKVSKSGAIKPVVEIETVDTGDCEMDSPTGYNAAFIRDMKIAKGARILVTRSGGVIPKILETLTPASDEEQHALWDEMVECPSCGEPTGWNANHIELCCTNPMCPGIRLAKIVFFYTICGAENMGEETIAKMFNAGFNSLKAMLDITFDELVSIDGFGEGIANVILENNKMIRDGIDIATLMHASDQFPGIGKVKAQQILDNLDGKLENALFNNEPVVPLIPSDEEVENMPVTLQSFWKGIVRFQRFIQMNELKIRRATIVSVNTNGKYKGMAVCFSGIRDAELEALIFREGGKIASGVSKKTTHLVVKDKDANSNKIFKARELGIPILTMDEFLAF
ncbi:MAG: BRCA1 C Terminus (BRCT) domain protein [Bacteroidales bacterium]|nr:BRCA1 C Terminus (BRCT) domain protein [Bacteroidales bacterium]